MLIANIVKSRVLYRSLFKKTSFFQNCLCQSFIMPYHVVARGSENTLDYKVYLKDENGPVSPLHDIPIFANEEGRIYNMIVEIPRWTNAKMEINLMEPLNPIKQDVKNGKLRYVCNCFPHHGYIWNYGAIPQTWENPNSVDSHTGFNGDGDPIDVMEIGYRVAKRGEVLQVKVLGTLALIDEGETDWKIFAIDVNDPLADQLNDIADVDKYFPGLLKATIEWYKIYKVPDGKSENTFAFNGEAKSAEFARKIIDETHNHWKSLMNKEVENTKVNCVNVKLTENSSVISSEQAEQIISQNPSPDEAQCIPPIVDKWHFISLKY